MYDSPYSLSLRREFRPQSDGRGTRTRSSRRPCGGAECRVAAFPGQSLRHRVDGGAGHRYFRPPIQVGGGDRSDRIGSRHHAVRRRGLPSLAGKGSTAPLADTGPGFQRPRDSSGRDAAAVPLRARPDPRSHRRSDCASRSSAIAGRVVVSRCRSRSQALVRVFQAAGRAATGARAAPTFPAGGLGGARTEAAVQGRKPASNGSHPPASLTPAMPKGRARARRQL